MTHSLMAWYSRHRRPLPWRNTSDPYRIWISEIMLQQTRVDTVVPYYHRFLERFPGVAALAAAPVDDVLKAWENLGYYARARHLHQAARIIVEKHNGIVPDTWEAITALPGIGRYTAGAILSIAFGKPFPAVDANVRRVLSRLFAIREPSDPKTQKAIAARAASLIPKGAAGSFNEALMDLGALVCTPKAPACAGCPLGRHCRARRQDLQHQLPMSVKRLAVPHRRTTAAVIENRQGRLLVLQRPARGLLASLWKLPGNMVKPGETLEAGLRRSVRDELGIGIRVGEQIAAVRHAYTHFRITLHAFRCTLRSGPPRTPDGRSWLWASPDDLDALAFSKADRAVIGMLRKTA